MWKLGIPLNYSSRIERQSVRGCIGGSQDEGSVMDMSTSADW